MYAADGCVSVHDETTPATDVRSVFCRLGQTADQHDPSRRGEGVDQGRFIPVFTGYAICDGRPQTVCRSRLGGRAGWVNESMIVLWYSGRSSR